MNENSTGRNMLLANALVFKVNTEALGSIVSSKLPKGTGGTLIILLGSATC